MAPQSYKRKLTAVLSVNVRGDGHLCKGMKRSNKKKRMLGFFLSFGLVLQLITYANVFGQHQNADLIVESHEISNGSFDSPASHKKHVFASQLVPVLNLGMESVRDTVELSDMVSESEEQNNQRKKNAKYSPLDLEVSNLRVTQDASATTFVIEVRNNGPGDATKAFKVYLSAGIEVEPGELRPKLLDCPPLKAGESILLHHEASFSIPDFQAKVEADYPDPVTETRIYFERETKLDNNVFAKEVSGRRVVLVVIDGLRSDKLKAYLDGELREVEKSGFLEIGLGPSGGSSWVEFTQASTVFPSITLSANASIVTGLYPAHHGITGNVFYKRDNEKWMDYESKELAPTLYGFYDQYGEQHWSAVLNQWQMTSAGSSGPDKDLEEFDVRTLYDVLKEYGYQSHVVFHFYSKGAGYDVPPHMAGFTEQLDGWDPPRKDDLIFIATIANNDGKSFFNHFDKEAASRARAWIENLPRRLPFPQVLTIYFASVDHASHLRGLEHKDGDFEHDIQREYLLKIDQELYHVIKAMKDRFPEVFNNTVFIITSDHGHMPVNREKTLTSDAVRNGMIYGPWFEEVLSLLGDQYYKKWLLKKIEEYGFETVGRRAIEYLTKKYIRLASNGPSVQVYVDSYYPRDANSYSTRRYKEGFLGVVGNFCYRWRRHVNPQHITRVIARMPGEEEYKEFWYDSGTGMLSAKTISNELPDVSAMLSNIKRSGDIILLLNQKEGWQFSDREGRPRNLSIPFNETESMRIPFSESFNSASTHGSVDTMEVPLLFVGQPIPENARIRGGSVVDIAPTILAMLGVPVPVYMDGKPLLDVELRPITGAQKIQVQMTKAAVEVASYQLAESRHRWALSTQIRSRDVEVTTFQLPTPKDSLLIRTVIAAAYPNTNQPAAYRGKVFVKGDSWATKDFSRPILIVDPESKNRKEFDAEWAEKGLSFFQFDSRNLADGPHRIFIQATLGEKWTVSHPREILIDNTPPSLALIERVEVDLSSEELAIVKVQATVADELGVSRVEIYAGEPSADGKMIGESYEIKKGRTTVIGTVEKATRIPYKIYLRVYDRAGNYLDSKPVTVSIKTEE